MAFTIEYGQAKFYSRPNETLLEIFLRHGFEIRFSCKKGVCKTCKTKVLSGTIPAGAQKDLAPHLVKHGIILPCVCIPETDMVLASPSEADLREFAQGNDFEFRNEQPNEHPPADPTLWLALGEGKLLLKILTEFYELVYADPRLSSFFTHTTIDRAIGKQYNFLEEIITGRLIFFGAYPRNAHHWMVISDELFDYREDLLEQVMIKNGLQEPFRRRWGLIHEFYRTRIVKTHPWPRIVGGQVIPLGGFETAPAVIDMVCDACSAEIRTGEPIRYHQQDGKVYCRRCAQLQ